MQKGHDIEGRHRVFPDGLREDAERGFAEHMLAESVGCGQGKAAAFGSEIQGIRDHPGGLQSDHPGDRDLVGMVNQFLLACVVAGRFGQAATDIRQYGPIHKKCCQQKQKSCGYVFDSLIHTRRSAAVPGVQNAGFLAHLPSRGRNLEVVFLVAQSLA